MKVTRIYSDDTGESRFEDIEIPLIDQGDIGSLSKREKATGVIFRTTPPDYNFDWHNAPQRQYVVMLEGSVDVTTSTGEKRRFTTGDILLAEDTEGKGHLSQAVDNQPRKSLFIVLE